MYSFKRNRLKAGNNSREWRPVPLQEFAPAEEGYTKESISNSSISNASATHPVTKATDSQEAEKPVIKLYRDTYSESDVAKDVTTSQDLLTSISREKNLYDASAGTLLKNYQTKVSAHIDKLIGVVLMNADEKSFIYPTAKINKTNVLCYVVTGAGISEEHLEISDIANCNPLPVNDAAKLQALISDYEGIKNRIQVYLANSGGSQPKVKQTTETYTSSLPLSILKDLSDNETAISKLAVGMVRYRP